jgi:HK97 family phage major capsid protein
MNDMKTLSHQHKNRFGIHRRGAGFLAMPRMCSAVSQTKRQESISPPARQRLIPLARIWMHLLKRFRACARGETTHPPEQRTNQTSQMKKFKKLLKPYRQLSYLLSVIILSLALFALHIIPAAGILFIVGCWQLLCFARSRRCGVCFTSILAPEQIEEFQDIMREFGRYKGLLPGLNDMGSVTGGFAAIKVLPDLFRKLTKDNDELRGDLRKLRKQGLGGYNGVRWIGEKPFVSEDCARALTSVFVLDAAKLKGGLDTLVPDANARDRVISFAAATLGVEIRTALTTTEIPVPTIYVPQIIELVFAYGQARQFATVFPLGAGTVKLPRLKAGEDDFGYLGVGTAGMSQTIPEKRVTAELVTFTANKFGGLIRIPYELEEDTFVPIGQFLARYIARQLAKGEDKTLFLADGTAAYANQTGIGPYCAANPTYLLQLAGGKTKPSDMTLNDIRNLRSKVSGAILGNMAANGGTSAAYYIHPTFEPFLRGFNTYPNFVVFEYVNGKPMFDGWPVRWLGVSQAYQTTAAPAAYCMFFGDLSYIYLGERGAVRVEVSKEVFFATDELAMRALERIDVEIMAIDAMASLQTAAA